MGNWSERHEAKKEVKEKEKASRALEAGTEKPTRL